MSEVGPNQAVTVGPNQTDRASKGHNLSERAHSASEHQRLLLAWSAATSHLLRWEVELRSRRLRRECIAEVVDLKPQRLEDLAARFFRHTRYDSAYGGQHRVKRTLDELRQTLRQTLRPAAYRNLLTYLYEQEHQLDTALGRGQLDKVRPLARRHNLVRDEVNEQVERRLDFETGHEVAV